MIFEYNGFLIHQIGIQRFFVTGRNFNGYTLSVIEAMNIIDCIDRLCD